MGLKPMVADLSGRTCVVTGASAGIGRATASELARLGARVVMAVRNPEKGEKARRAIKKATGNGDVEIATVDLARQESIRAFARELATRWYAPLLEKESWTAALYLLVGTITAVTFFVALVVLGTLVFGLLFVVVGIFLIRPFFAAAELMVGIERSMARWVDVEIDPRPVAPMAGLGLRALTDAERWRHVGFLLLNVFIGTLIGNVGLLGFEISSLIVMLSRYHR